jgi:hypothetical protein
LNRLRRPHRQLQIPKNKSLDRCCCAISALHFINYQQYAISGRRRLPRALIALL